jgi:hypothetical protein
VVVPNRVPVYDWYVTGNWTAFESRPTIWGVDAPALAKRPQMADIESAAPFQYDIAATAESRFAPEAPSVRNAGTVTLPVGYVKGR